MTYEEILSRWNERGTKFLANDEAEVLLKLVIPDLKIERDGARYEANNLESEVKAVAAENVKLRAEVERLGVCEDRMKYFAAEADKLTRQICTLDLQNSELKDALAKLIQAAKDSRQDPRLKGHLRVDDIVDADQVLKKDALKPKDADPIPLCKICGLQATISVDGICHFCVDKRESGPQKCECGVPLPAPNIFCAKCGRQHTYTKV
jgi:hypothetical protein